ncbi:MAG: hypothetical protein OXE84_01790 [Rhodobacteraceae bacterium]|nr:hypothetical protein [Paracoccaceae bacterium]MCY4195305.1 hypothetical protein [Paracoccaceae bacterium]
MKNPEKRPSTLETAERSIANLRSKPNAPPFIGLIPMDEAQHREAVSAVRFFLRGHTSRLRSLFDCFPNLGTWLVTNSLSRGYGSADNHAVYRHIAHTLEIPLAEQQDRKILYESFCLACQRFGLPTRGFDRFVDVYLLHAGVSEAQIEHVVEAFRRQESAFGPPPVEATALLNRWEDDALLFLPETLTVLRRPIEWDETAWHASLYARILRDSADFKPEIEFEKRFKEEFDESGGRPNSTTSPPRPRIIWRSDGLSLRLPHSDGRIQLWLDKASRPLRLRGGEDWTLPQPWPRSVRWKIAEHEGKFDVVTNYTCTLFDKITGHQLKEIRPDQGEAVIDSTNVVIIARFPFSIDEKSAFPAEAESFVSFATPRHRPVRLNFGEHIVVLRAKPKRRLSISGGEVADGPRGKLYGPTAHIVVETGLGKSGARLLRLKIGDQSKVVQININEGGLGEVSLQSLLVNFEDYGVSDPTRVKMELMAPTEQGETGFGSGIELSVWAWPAFIGRDEHVFHCAQPINNLVREKCAHVKQTDKGELVLDRTGGYIVARAVFEINDEHVPFDMAWPDVTVTRRRSDGSESLLPFGSRISASEDDRFDTITIRCPDTKAGLIVRGRHEVHPFHQGLTRNLAFRDLLKPEMDNRIMLKRSNGVKIMLFELVKVFSPQAYKVVPSGHNIRLQLKFSELVDAVAAEVEDEKGCVVRAEAALRHRPVEARRPDWFHAEICTRDPYRFDVDFETYWLDDGPRLARLFVRPDGKEDWRPLRNEQGQSFAVALMQIKSSQIVFSDNLSRRFQSLCLWLSDCYDSESWPLLQKTLVPRWQHIGKELITQSGGEGAVIGAAALPPPDHAPSKWVPAMHPLQFIPNLYAASPYAFSRLATAIGSGIAEMSAISMLNTARLRDQSNLHQTVYLAFSNIHEAEKSGKPLKGFETARFFRNLPLVDDDPSAGWFWRGTPLLGPDHWRAAFHHFNEQLENAALFVDDDISNPLIESRQRKLQRLIYAAWFLEDPVLRPPAPKRSPEADEPEQVDLWAAALISGFARESRKGDVNNFVKLLSKHAKLTTAECLSSIALVLRLAPRLFAFHLLLWQIAKDRP